MPVIWLIDAYRAGERAQVRALVNALGWPCEIKALDYRKAVVWPHVLGHSSLAGITAESAQQLQGPWPDLVISCGVRNEPVCRWIKAQSGGHTQYVHVGRPWGALEGFDLVITTPQYRVPERPNVITNLTTLHGVTPSGLASALERWAPEFADLPRPHFAVIAGGDSGPFTLGPVAARRLGEQASTLAAEHGGSLLVTTSSRTRPAAVSALRSAISVPCYFYQWSADSKANPYMGILADADRLIVTADSIAMLSESCATGKPVQMFDLGGMRGESDHAADFRLGASAYAFVMRWLWQPLSRDITLAHQRLRAAGRVVWLEERFGATAVPGASEMERTVDAVRRLLGQV